MMMMMTMMMTTIGKVLIVIATCYHAVASQTNDDPLTTADGTRIESTGAAYDQRILAVSRDLLPVLPYGTQVVVECDREEINGVWTIHDTMNARYENTVDFLLNPGMPVFKEEITIHLTTKDD